MYQHIVEQCWITTRVRFHQSPHYFSSVCAEYIPPLIGTHTHQLYHALRHWIHTPALRMAHMVRTRVRSTNGERGREIARRPPKRQPKSALLRLSCVCLVGPQPQRKRILTHDTHIHTLGGAISSDYHFTHTHTSIVTCIFAVYVLVGVSGCMFSVKLISPEIRTIVFGNIYIMKKTYTLNFLKMFLKTIYLST